MSDDLKPGDRVRMTAAGLAQGLNGRVKPPCHGTVTTARCAGGIPYIRVRKDGQKRAGMYHRLFWERLGDA